MLLQFFLLLVVAFICGSIAQALVGFSRGGCLVSIALGFIGALLGHWLAREFGLPELFDIQIGDTSFPVIWSIIGATLFSAALSLITRSRGPRV